MKLPKRIIFGICLLCGLLLFSKDSVLSRLAVFDFKTKYNFWIGIVFLCALTISIMNLIEIVIVCFKKRKDNKKRKDQIANRMKSLDSDELSVIREFIIQKKNTVEMPLEDSTVVSLANEGVLTQVSNQGYRDNIAGCILFFKLSDTTMHNIELLDFKSIETQPRPIWIQKIEASKSFNKRTTDLINGMIS